MHHPTSLTRRIRAVQAEASFGTLAHLHAREASRALSGARYHIGRLYAPIHSYGSSPTRIQHWLRIGRVTHMRLAKIALRDAAMFVRSAEREAKGLVVPVLRQEAA